MRLSSRSAAAALALFVAVTAAGPAAAVTPVSMTPEEGVVFNAIEGYIRPAYADLASAASNMVEDQAALCTAPSRDALHDARKGFQGLVTAFSRVEYVRFGPIMEDNRLERILFWPDRRGVVLRQVQAILATKDETATDAPSLHAKSVAVQGLNALEFVLFGTDAQTLAEAEGNFRCRYGLAVAGNISGIASALSSGWQAEDGIAMAMMHPLPTSPAYRSSEDALQEIAGVFVNGFEAIRDLKIKPAFGETIDKANPKAWIYQRSGLTEVSLQTNFAGLSELFDRSRIADILPTPQAWMKASIAFEFGNAGRAFQAIGASLADASATAKTRDRVGYLLILTSSLQSLFADQLSQALGLTAGFSALDGD